MRSFTGILVLSAGLAIIPGRPLAAQTDRPAEGRWGCYSAYEDDPIYVTKAWDGTAMMEDVRAAFKQMLLTKYGYQGRISCSRANMTGSTLAGVQAGRDAQFAQWQKNGKKVVETGWTFGAPDPGAPVPTPTPDAASGGAAAPSERSSWAVCRMTVVSPGKLPQTKVKRTYLSGVFGADGAIDKGAVEKAFAGFVGKKYRATTQDAECKTGASRPDAAAALAAWMDKAATDPGTYGSIVKTGWVNAPPPPP